MVYLVFFNISFACHFLFQCPIDFESIQTSLIRFNLFDLKRSFFYNLLRVKLQTHQTWIQRGGERMINNFFCLLSFYSFRCKKNLFYFLWIWFGLLFFSSVIVNFDVNIIVIVIDYYLNRANYWSPFKSLTDICFFLYKLSTPWVVHQCLYNVNSTNVIIALTLFTLVRWIFNTCVIG